MSVKFPFRWSLAITEPTFVWLQRKDREDRTRVIDTIRNFLEMLRTAEEGGDPEMLELENEIRKIRKLEDRAKSELSDASARRMALESKMRMLEEEQEEKETLKSATEGIEEQTKWRLRRAKRNVEAVGLIMNAIDRGVEPDQPLKLALSQVGVILEDHELKQFYDEFCENRGGRS